MELITKPSLAVSNIGFAEAEDAAAWALLQRYGFTGLEAAPTRLVGARPYQKLPQAARKAAWLRENHGLEIPSLQSIWYGQTGNLFVPADAARLAAYTRRAVDFAAAVGCPSLVFGCPRQRFVPEGARPEAAMGFFADISAYACAKGVRIALEANPPAYGTNFCNTSAEAFRYARQVPGLAVNYDLGTLLTNGERLDVLADNLPLVSHIHLSEPALAPIQKRALHKELVALLKARGYGGFVSIEMKTQPLAVLEPILSYVAEVFA